MKAGIKSITFATLFAVSSPVIALAQADSSVDRRGGASTSAEGTGADTSASANADAPMSSARGTEEAAKLNLLAGGQFDLDSGASKMRIGDGSYLCTPAGFGQRSWCLAN